MKNVLRNPIFIGLVSFTLGILSFYSYQRFYQQKKLTTVSNHASLDPFFDDFYSDNFFQKPTDPFESMKKMRELMNKDFFNPDGKSNQFDSWFKKRFGGGDAQEITQKEDDKYLYYVLKIDNLAQTKVDVKVANNQISFSGEVKQTSKNENSAESTFSSFQRSFPLPPNVDSAHYTTTQENGEIVVKFPKLSPT